MRPASSFPTGCFTHFERQEGAETRGASSKASCGGPRRCLQQGTEHSVVVMNEGFASTTLHDARFIGTQVLERLLRLGVLGVYVTFVDDLAAVSEAMVSMVGQVDPADPARRTFRIIREPASGLAHAAAIADQFGLGYERLRERLARESPPDAPHRRLRPGQGLPPHSAGAGAGPGPRGAAGTPWRGRTRPCIAVARRALLCGVADPGVIAYRQQRAGRLPAPPHGGAGDVRHGRGRRSPGDRRIFGFTPTAVLDVSVRTLSGAAAPPAGAARDRRRAEPESFRSHGFERLFAALESELDEEYLQSLDAHLRVDCGSRRECC